MLRADVILNGLLVVLNSEGLFSIVKPEYALFVPNSEGQTRRNSEYPNSELEVRAGKRAAKDCGFLGQKPPQGNRQNFVEI